MAIVTYGAWEISVDIEKTREYYKSIKATKGQANRNFMKYCETLSEEELLEKGGNSSANHVDFMIGTADLSITGIDENGNKTAVFENGNFVI